jgi:hypothetical protein
MFSNPFYREAGLETDGFADPFRSISSRFRPKTFRNALYWSEYIWDSMGGYRIAMERIVSYFVTDLEVRTRLDEDTKRTVLDVLNDQMDIVQNTWLMLRDLMAYGNSFCSVIHPFKRHLLCPKTGEMYVLSEVYSNPVFKFQFTEDLEFVATSPKSGWRGPWEVKDLRKSDEKRFLFKRWNVHEIEIVHNFFTGENLYLWRIPDRERSIVRKGELFDLERVPLEVLKAIKENRMFKFHPNVIYHMKEESLSGHRNRGWGLPRSLTNFNQLFQVQVLRCANEALAMDYVIPFRLITPESRNAGGSGASTSINDPLSMISASDLRRQLERMLVNRRRDPAGFQILPFPVQFQMLGADAKHLMPIEQLQHAMESLLNELGTPVEFYNGSLAIQAAPAALRLFESTHGQLVKQANKFLNWVANNISQTLNWPDFSVGLKRVTMTDSMEKQMMLMQLMMSGDISRTTGLSAIGHDREIEQQMLADEARSQQKIQQRMEEEMEQEGFAAQIEQGITPAMQSAQEQQAQGGGGAPAGAGAAQGSGQGGVVNQYLANMSPDAQISPNQLLSLAQEMAAELLRLPESIKDSELRQLKQKNELLHASVIQQMNQQRQAMRREGGEMLRQQGGGGS